MAVTVSSESGFCFSPEVASALRDMKPIVALESTIISHGMPFPQNLEVAQKLEKIIRSYNVIPATIAVLKGIVHIGLTSQNLEFLARAGKKVLKLSRRDVAYAQAKKLDGATTVATTMLFAARVGIPLFVTGGIGGVHRNGSTSAASAKDPWDISADLIEFSKSPVAVICAGAKSILDLPRTLEVLETNGVPVIGMKTKHFPNFFTQSSGLKLQATVDTCLEMAQIVIQQVQGQGSGMVICNPIPKSEECHAADKAIQQALQEADERKIVGKDITPFLLARVNELTKGKSLEANIALVTHNAHVGAQIAVELWKLGGYNKPKLNSDNGSSLVQVNQNLDLNRNFSSNFRHNISGNKISGKDLIQQQDPLIRIIGGATVDYMCRPAKVGPLHTSLPGRILTRCGGVGRNIAEAAANLHKHRSNPVKIVELITAVGADVAAETIVGDCQNKNIKIKEIRDRASDMSSAQYAAMLDGKGDLVSAVADMNVFTLLDEKKVKNLFTNSSTPQALIIDGNVPESLVASIQSTDAIGQIWFEPVSVPKAIKFNRFNKTVCSLITPNIAELEAILEDQKVVNIPELKRKFNKSSVNNISESDSHSDNDSAESPFNKEYSVCLIESFIEATNGETACVLTCGPDGCIIGVGKNTKKMLMLKKTNQNLQKKEPDSDQFQTDHYHHNLADLKEISLIVQKWRKQLHHELILKASSDKCNILWIRPIMPAQSVVNVTGAGDTLCGAMAWGYFYAGLSLPDSVILGMMCAVKTIQYDGPVAPNLHELFDLKTSKL